MTGEWAGVAGTASGHGPGPTPVEGWWEGGAGEEKPRASAVPRRSRPDQWGVTRPSPQPEDCHTRQGPACPGPHVFCHCLGSAPGKCVLSADAAGDPRGRLRGCQPRVPRPRVLWRGSWVSPPWPLHTPCRPLHTDPCCCHV